MRPVNDERPWVAIGDVHGRADMLSWLLDAVERDLPDARVVLLGDLVDRGPDIRGVIRLARELAGRFAASEVLLGNHEDWFLSAVDGDEVAREDWLTWGGEATCRAFGVDPWRDRPRLAAAFEPYADELAFLRARPRTLEGFGAAAGHLFVHAGVDPLAPLHEQDPRDLIWMREPFLSWPHELEKRIVHGHTATPQPELRVHRIGVDTGAVYGGVLTAVVLRPGEAPRFMAARDDGHVAPIQPSVS